MRATLAAFVCFATSLGPVAANEADYELVRGFPSIRGELTETLAAPDEAGALWLVRRVYQQADAHAITVTIVREAHCGGRPGPTGAAVVPHIMAIQYRPRAPKSFAEATLHDIFLEVYVADPKGQIRRYRNLGAQEIAVLTEKLRPSCTGI